MLVGSVPGFVPSTSGFHCNSAFPRVPIASSAFPIRCWRTYEFADERLTLGLYDPNQADRDNVSLVSQPRRSSATGPGHHVAALRARVFLLPR
jgi:hypothetical protein